MKKSLSVLFALCSIVSASFAQTFVSTTPSNKNVVLEEFTGKACVYCPDGHRIANTIAANNPERVCIINIHEGGYASGTPNYTTAFGTNIMNQTGLQGFPSGTINRHVFSGSNTILSRTDWNVRSNTILSQPSCVNVAARSTIDFSTRILTVDVEIYYTANSAVSTNKLNVALLQNNILGPQTGMNYNPTQVIEGQYNHNHMLRHLLTGQWGEDIETTTAGTFISKQYTYTIPEHLNNIHYALEDLDVVVFIAEGRQEILTGAKSEMSLLNPAPTISAIRETNSINCEGETVEVSVKNLLDVPVSSLAFSYTYSGVTETLRWDEETIPAWGSVTIPFPEIPVPSGVNVPVTVTLTEADGVTLNSQRSITLKKSVVHSRGNMELVLNTDQYASETTFKVYAPNGSVLLSGGPWQDLSRPGTTERVFQITPPTVGCYKFEILDSYEDGINTGYGAGNFSITDLATNTILVNHNGRFTSKVSIFINYDNTDFIEQYEKNDIIIYPNPTQDHITIETTEMLNTIEIYNMQGQKILHQEGTPTISVTDFTSGIYIMKIHTEQNIYTRKFIKQ